jgi:hypothetical protein
MSSFPPGRYVCRVKNQGFSKSKNGVDQFFVVIDVLQEVDAQSGIAQPVTSGERTVYFTLKTEQNGRYFIRDMYELSGQQIKSFSQLDPNADGFTSLDGREAEFLCEENEYNGKMTERWKIAPGQLSSSSEVALGLDSRLQSAFDGQFSPNAAASAVGNANRELLEEAATLQDDPNAIPF